MERSDEIIRLLKAILAKLEKIEGHLYSIDFCTESINNSVSSVDNNTR